jgi:tripartite-type tricarboxylate transporter receptor subunit TctC
LRISLTAGVLLSGIAVAAAQSYPSKPVMIICSQPPGSGPDTMVRLYAEVISRNVGQRILVSNHPGAGGVLAAANVAKAPPDGYTLLLVLNGTHIMVPAMQSVPFDPIKDFEFITLLYSSSGVLIVPTASPAKSFAELLDLARTKAGGVSYGSPAIGSPSHLMGAMLSESTHIPMTHVAYRGGTPLLVDLIGGLLDFTFISSVQALPHIAQGQVRALAVAGSSRLSLLPDVPTLGQLGHGDGVVESWFGIAAPKGTPPDIIAKVNAEFMKASQDPVIIKRAEEDSVSLRTGSPDEFLKLLNYDNDRLGSAVRRLGIKSE